MAIASDFSPSASNCSAQIRRASATGIFMPAGVFLANALSSLAAADVPIRPSEWAAAWATWISESPRSFEMALMLFVSRRTPSEPIMPGLSLLLTFGSASRSAAVAFSSGMRPRA